MANRLLTLEEKTALAADLNFKLTIEDKVLSYSNFWSNHDGGSGVPATLAGRTKWAKDRILAVQTMKNGINDQTIVEKAFRVSQAQQVDLGTAPQASATIIAAMSAQGKFDELASLYFDLLGENIDFTLGGA